MADPLVSLRARFSSALRTAVGEEHADTDPMLRRSDRADAQANVAMALAKKLGKPPRKLAEELVSKLDLADVCERVEIAGPGFVNLTFRSDWLARELETAARDERLGVPQAAQRETVVIDYSAPNVAKEMHVGHLRSTILGDALARVLGHLGHHVIRQNHIGDWGTPFGMLIEHLVDLGEGAESSIADLSAFYKQARAKFDADPSFGDRARRRVVLLQSGDAATLELWQRLVAVSKRYFDAIYLKLGVTLADADIRGESFYNPLLPETARDLESRGLARDSDGALCVFPAGFKNKEGEPLPLIVRKQDGGFGYAATDLAAIRYRTTTLGAHRILYVVGAPQQQHLEMVFAVARDAGYLAPPARAEHVAFGSVLGEDKKMLKSRSGDAVRLVDLLDEAVTRARAVVDEKAPELEAPEREAIARAVGIGAIKYADLSSDRIKDYIFDWSRMLSFDGNTAPYLQYAHARIRSIVGKAGGEVNRDAPVVLGAPEERALAIDLLSFAGVLPSVVETLHPHKLCTYLFDVATAFSAFYEKCSVLKAETPEARASRLVLSELTARVLERGLELLGIEAPQRM
jgi:arginyl-tRNA synthetase